MDENITGMLMSDLITGTDNDFGGYTHSYRDDASTVAASSKGAHPTRSPVYTTTKIDAIDTGPITWDDATWILTSSFIIFTMQSGFGLLEAGVVSGKNEVNIMVKNAVDVIFGGITFWMFGFGLSFGEDPYWNNPFCGVGYFFVDVEDGGDKMGLLYANYIFQLSFATTATTIVSGAMAERTKLTSYIIFSFFNTVVYCIPAHWVWGAKGWLNSPNDPPYLKCIDIAGSGAVHLLGGVSALVAAILLKPRIGRYDNGQTAPPLGNATNCLVGMFMLWWGWLGFNCGSTFGISGGKWKLAAKSAVTTINASMAGGAVGIIYSFIVNKRKYSIPDLVNSVLGGLVAVTASCAVVRPYEAIPIGGIGGLLGCLGTRFLDYLHIDDPVGAGALHGFCGLWNSSCRMKRAIARLKHLFHPVMQLPSWHSGVVVAFAVRGISGVWVAPCAIIRPWESFVIGAIGGAVSIFASVVMDKLRIDDPVGAVAVHGAGGIWGMLAVGIFVDIDPMEDTTHGQKGLIHGGGFRLLGVQALACVAIITWSAVSSFILLFAIDKTLGLRLSPEDEKLGTDFTEHGIGAETDLFLIENRRSIQETGCQTSIAIRRRSRGGFGFQRTTHYGKDSSFIQQDGKLTPELDTNGVMNPVFDGNDGSPKHDLMQQ